MIRVPPGDDETVKKSTCINSRRLNRIIDHVIGVYGVVQYRQILTRISGWRRIKVFAPVNNRGPVRPGIGGPPVSGENGLVGLCIPLFERGLRSGKTSVNPDIIAQGETVFPGIECFGMGIELWLIDTLFHPDLMGASGSGHRQLDCYLGIGSGFSPGVVRGSTGSTRCHIENSG